MHRPRPAAAPGAEPRTPPADAGQGRSADGTLIYEWKVAATGERHFEAKLWNGRDYRTVLSQKIPAPKP